MKTWPKNDTVYFEDLTDPLRKVVDDLYKLERKPYCDIDYKGYGLPNESSYSFQPNERLNEENLRYDDEDQGRDAMTVVIGLAVQLGIEQGTVMERKRCKETFKVRLWEESQKFISLMSLEDW